ncbi:MAG TPA: O-antigen ligase family protein [Candidatus Andersenbacteria bacterium]|nr:O-antigen ligase family protein [Candidatus Andersenbacteria bacterium]
MRRVTRRPGPIPASLSVGGLSLFLLFLALLAGQTIRFPLPGQGGGLLVSDIAIVLILLTALWQLMRSRLGASRLSIHYLLLTTPFIIWSFFSLALNVPALQRTEAAIAFSYWLRLTTHLLLLPALLLLFQQQHLKVFARRGLVVTAACLAALGLLQLWLVPDLKNFTGWDPHQGRLVSTWLDPNFFGAFLAMMLPVAIGWALLARRSPALGGGVGWCSLIIVALILTQSRSAILALTLACLLLSPLLLATFLQKSTTPRRVTAVNLLALTALLLTLTSLLLAERLKGLVTIDPTVTLRVSALREAWYMAQEHSLIGVGYNAYQFAAARAGLISNFSLHSRAGADSSYLTLWVTTGFPGLLLFLLPLGAAGAKLLRHPRLSRAPEAAAAALALLTLAIHANFVNSFLYAHLLITLSLIVALTLSE